MGGPEKYHKLIPNFQVLRLDIGMNTTFLKNGRMVLGILFVLGCCACSDESVPAGKVTEESVYDRMGRLHNEGLDYVLERISEEAPFTRSGARKLPPAEEIRDMCDDFARMCGYVCPARTRAGSEVSDDFSFLSVAQQEWVGRLKSEVGRVTPERTEDFAIAVGRLEQQVELDDRLAASERESVRYAMAVGRYSAVYWAENYERWMTELFGVGKLPLNRMRTRSEEERFVTKEWWENYKTVVWSDGMSAVRRGEGYYLQGAVAGSVMKYLDQ